MHVITYPFLRASTISPPFLLNSLCFPIYREVYSIMGGYYKEGVVRVVLCVVVLLVQKSGAYDFVVGGQKGWSVPSDPNFNPYNTWAEKSRFQVGDSLVFNYQSGQDSVLEVKSEDYANCNTDSPIAKFSDGHTVYKFKHSGHHFFISGNKDNCVKNEKLAVIVLADRRNNYKNQTTNSTTPSPSPSPSPSPPPPAASPPSPPPSATSPPAPSPGTETNPTPAPASQTPPSPSHSGASSVLVGFAGTVGAFLASTLVLSLSKY